MMRNSKFKTCMYAVAIALVVAGIFVAYNYRGGRADTAIPKTKELPVKREFAKTESVKVVTVKRLVKAAMENVRPTTAVVNFTVDPSVKVDLTGSSIAVKLEQALGNQYRLVTRSQVSKALTELRFQSSDLVNRSKAKKFGHMLGADYLITGSVVQIGKEITLACQRFNIETGAIKQTAEVSAVNVDDFNHMIREAAMILGMSATDKQQYTDKKINYPKYLKAGKKAFAANNFGEAVQHFKLAQSIKQTHKVSILLKTAEAKAEEQRIQNEYTVKYQEAMRQGRKLLCEHKLNEADAVFKEALKIPGYKYNKSLLSGIKVISNREDVINFDKFMDREKTITVYVPGDVKTIQAAMNMANAGDTVYLEPGVYRETIVFKEGVTLKGHDKKQCRILPVSATAAVIIALDCRSGSIQNLTIDGSSQDSDKVYGLGIKTKTVNGKYIFVGTEPGISGFNIPKGAELLTVNGSPYSFFPYLIALQGKDKKVTLKYRLNGSTIKSVSMQSYKTGEAGIFPDGIAVLNSTIEVKDCIISNLKGSGIFASGHRSKLIAKNNICSFNNAGIYVDAMAEAQIEGNQCSSNEYGIALIQEASGKIAKNTCNNNSAYGIYMNHKSNAALKGNICIKNEYGIVFNQESAGKIIRNKCSKNSHSGILVDNKSTAQVDGNQCDKNINSGIVFNRESTGSISLNKCSDNYCGIFVSTKSVATVKGNKCNKNTNVGIAFAHGARGKIINNTCHQNKQGLGQDKRKMALLIHSNSIINR